MGRLFRPAMGLILLVQTFALLIWSATAALSQQLYDPKTNTLQCLNTLELERFVEAINGEAVEADLKTIWVITEDRKSYFVWKMTMTDGGFEWCITAKESFLET